MRELRPVPVREQSQHNAYVSKDLASCTHVFMRNDAVQKPLQQPYNGPFRVLERTDKYFTLELDGRKDKVSLDRACILSQYLAQACILRARLRVQPND